MKRTIIPAAALLAATLAVAGCDGGGTNDASAGENMSSVTLGTHATGGAFNALGTGMASVVTSSSDVRMGVQPYSGPNSWMPDLDNGSIQFGLLSATDASWAVTAGPGFDSESRSLRTVAGGNDVTNLALVTTERSSVTHLSDLGGKPVSSDYGGGFLNAQLASADLESVGMSWDDVQAVPMADAFVGLDALGNGQVDASAGLSPTTPQLVELDSSNDVVPLPFGDLTPADVADGVPDDAQAILDEYVPGSTLTVGEPGEGILTEETVLISYPLQLASSTHVPEQTVYDVLEALWEQHDALGEAHVWGNEWTRDVMPTSEFFAPYHDGAVRFFQDAGVWTPEMQERQDELLAEFA